MYRAVAELVFASVFWGFGFVATVWSFDTFTPVGLTFYRFFIAFIVGLFLFKTKDQIQFFKKHWMAYCGGGFFLSAMLLLQTIGLQYTTPTKSGFITTLYVLIVPLLHMIIHRIVNIGMLFLAFIALCGTALIVDYRGGEFNPGDLWTVAAAWAGAFHILWVDRYSKKINAPFLFNHGQALFASATIGLWLLISSQASFQGAWTAKTILTFTSLSLGSTLLAFALQVRAQRILSPTVSSLLFLLESPMALMFSFLLLDERLKGTQWIGAAIIMLSAVLAVRLEQKQKFTEHSQKSIEVSL